jgi:hypothetical protein
MIRRKKSHGIHSCLVQVSLLSALLPIPDEHAWTDAEKHTERDSQEAEELFHGVSIIQLWNYVKSRNS